MGVSTGGGGGVGIGGKMKSKQRRTERKKQTATSSIRSVSFSLNAEERWYSTVNARDGAQAEVVRPVKIASKKN